MNRTLEESTSQSEDVLRKMDKDMKEDMKRKSSRYETEWLKKGARSTPAITLQLQHHRYQQRS